MRKKELKEKIIEIYEKNHQKHKDCNTRSGECSCERSDLADQISELFSQREKEIRKEEFHRGWDNCEKFYGIKFKKVVSKIKN